MSDESLRERLGRHKSTAEGAADSLADDDRAILSEVRVIAGAMVMLLIIAMVLTEVFNAASFETDTNGNYVGPFGDVISALEGTGAAALTLLVVGMLVVAASAIMRYFGSGFGMGGGR